MSELQHITSPFEFLDSYTRQDRDIFFGREKETDSLYELVNQNRLILLYGPSGAGKTSLIQCGLSNRFHPANWLPLFVRRGNDLNHSLRLKLEEALGEKQEGSLVELIEELYEEQLRPIYLIFDQLEEIFVLGDDEEREEFIRDIAALNAAKLPCRIIFSLREEYLAHLYPFERVIPQLFDRRLRVEPMSVANASKVVLSSCQKFNISFEDEAANTQQIIDKISAGKSGLSLPYLQVYLDRLYKEDLIRTYGKNIPEESCPALEFTTEEIDNLGDIGDVLNVFLQEQVNRIQEALAKRQSDAPPRSVRKILNSFASLEGTKIPRSKTDISLKGLEVAGQSYILDELEQSRILREEDGTYELAHDTLSLRISEQRSAADIALLEAAELVQSRMRAFERTGAYLNNKELQLIENYKLQLEEEEKLGVAGWDFVNESQKTYNKAQLRRKLITTGIIAVLSTFLIFAAWQWREARRNIEMVVQRDMLAKTEAINEFELEYAEKLIIGALDLNSSNPEVQEGILELAYYYNEIGRTSKADSLLVNIEEYPEVNLDSPTSEAIIGEIKSIAGAELFSKFENRYDHPMIQVEGGTFWMGDSSKNHNSLHQVKLDNFEIGKFEVSVFQYELYLQLSGKTLNSIGSTPSWGGWNGDNPMIYVDWYDAIEYCNWLSKRKGYSPVYLIDKEVKDTLNNQNSYDSKRYTVEIDSQANGYRLPTEAEWEYAAGGGKRGRTPEGIRKHIYAGSDSLDRVGWYSANSDSLKKGVNRTLGIGLKIPNELGIFDMSGNVWEWCQDWYAEDYYQNGANSYMPRGPKSGSSRVLRGGSWDNDDSDCRVSNRGDLNPNDRYDGDGVRFTRRLP